MGKPLLRLFQRLLRIRQIPVGDLRGAGQVADPLCLLDIRFQGIDLLLGDAHLINDLLLVAPLSHHSGGFLLEIRLLLFDLFQARFGSLIGLLLQRLLLHLKLHDLPFQHVDLRGHGVELDLQTGRCLVDQIHRLVRQETVGNVAIGKHSSGNNGTVLDTNAVMDFVAFLEPTQDGDSILH